MSLVSRITKNNFFTYFYQPKIYLCIPSPPTKCIFTFQVTSEIQPSPNVFRDSNDSKATMMIYAAVERLHCEPLCCSAGGGVYTASFAGIILSFLILLYSRTNWCSLSLRDSDMEANLQEVSP